MLRYSVDSLKFAGFVGLSLGSLFGLRLFLSFVGAWICHSTVISDKGPWGLAHLWSSIGSVLAECCPALAQQVWCQVRGADKPSLSSSSGTPHRTRQICHRTPNTHVLRAADGAMCDRRHRPTACSCFTTHTTSRESNPLLIFTQHKWMVMDLLQNEWDFCKRIIGWKLKLRISKNLHSFSHSFICLI